MGSIAMQHRINYVLDNRHGRLNDNGTAPDQSRIGPSSLKSWNEFFLAAGIPAGVAREYAPTFAQHRVRLDMLKDINKEILLDLGIKAMGDIIAVLRHAKVVSMQNELAEINNAANEIVDVNTTVAATKINHRLSTTTKSNQNSAKQSGPVKMQSRISQASGALASTTATTASNKRIHKQSSAPSKRLRPEQNLPEKTLTVHYPSREAIVKAQQRISNGTTTSASIRDRLGAPPSSSNDVSDRLPTSASGTVWSRVGSTGAKSSTQPAVAVAAAAAAKATEKPGERARGRGDVKHNNQTNRLKSTVFTRLGQNTR